jgi:hypothetical protein
VSWTPRCCEECGTWLQRMVDGSSPLPAHYELVHPDLAPPVEEDPPA